MVKYIKNVLAALGLLTLISLISMTISFIVVWQGRGEVPGEAILEYDFSEGLVEYLPDDPAARFVDGNPLRVMEVVEALEMAAEDDRIKVFVARIGPAYMGLARIQEIRDAVAAFRRSGKKAVAFTDTFGEFGPGNGVYYLACAFDEIYMQPSGEVSLTGLLVKSPFVKGTLDKLGVKPRMDHRKEYKTAMNLFTETEFTEAQEEALGRILESLTDGMVDQIAEDRGLPGETVRAHMEEGILAGEAAVAAGLVDGLAYQDQVYEKIQEEIGEAAEPLDLSGYLRRGERRYGEGEETIALIYGIGNVHRGASEYNPLTGDVLLSSQRVGEAFRQAVEDEAVKAILFRVDSPGGSYVASDTVWRETLHAKAAGKPVIVSMGNVAGSGGYFVAMAADKIVAHPATITGSIGVVAGKMVTRAFWEKLGVTWDEMHNTPAATMWTAIEDYTPRQWALLQEMLDRIYGDFTTKVAEGRNLPLEEVKEIAKGRIWTGADALDLGLVDALGGYPLAIRLAREAAGIDPGRPVRLKRFPPRKPFLQTVLQRLGITGEPIDPMAGAREAVRTLGPLLRLLPGGGSSLSDPGVLSMPAFRVR